MKLKLDFGGCCSFPKCVRNKSKVDGNLQMHTLALRLCDPLGAGLSMILGQVTQGVSEVINSGGFWSTELWAGQTVGLGSDYPTFRTDLQPCRVPPCSSVFWRESRNTSWFPTPFSPFLFCFLRYYSWTAGKKKSQIGRTLSRKEVYL